MQIHFWGHIFLISIINSTKYTLFVPLMARDLGLNWQSAPKTAPQEIKHELDSWFRNF